jgi:hypothetical protein
MVSRPVAIVVAVLVTITLFLNLPLGVSRPVTHQSLGNAYQFNFSRDANSHSLTTSQCDVAFPRLFDRVDEAVSLRRRHEDWVMPEDLNIPVGRCMLRAMIYQGEVRCKIKVIFRTKY